MAQGSICSIATTNYCFPTALLLPASAPYPTLCLLICCDLIPSCSPFHADRYNFRSRRKILNDAKPRWNPAHAHQHALHQLIDDARKSPHTYTAMTNVLSYTRSRGTPAAKHEENHRPPACKGRVDCYHAREPSQKIIVQCNRQQGHLFYFFLCCLIWC